MLEMLTQDTMWLAAAAVWIVFLLIALERPRALWRRLSAYESTAPWLATFVLAGGTVFFGKMVFFHIDKLLEATIREAPEHATVGAFLYWLLAFLWQGAVGSLAMRAHGWATLSWLGLLAIFAALLYRQRYSLFAMDIVDRRGEEAPPRRVVIMGLSLDQKPGTDEKATDAAVATFKAAASRLDLEAVAAPRPELRFPWQQNLRVLRHHLLRPLPAGWMRRAWGWLARRLQNDPARVVVVVPSRESARYAEDFVAVAEACVTNSGCRNVQFKIWPRAVDYNDLGALRRELQAAVRMLQESAAIAARLDEISIDTTPGMKLVSIAGAAVTFASPLEFTYVETMSPNNVVAFDVRAAFRVPFER